MMTKYIQLPWPFLGLVLLTSCSNDLSHSQAQNIIQRCHDNTPPYQTTNLKYGNKIHLDDSNLSAYKTLANMDLIRLNQSADPKYPNTYNVGITNQGEAYVHSKGKSPSGVQYAQVQLFDYKLTQVKSIHQAAGSNTAEVHVILNAQNKTPFSILNPNIASQKKSTKTLSKSANGWIYCDISIKNNTQNPAI